MQRDFKVRDVNDPYAPRSATSWANVPRTDVNVRKDTRALVVNSRPVRDHSCPMMVSTTYHVLDTVIVYTDPVTVTRISPERVVISVREI